MSTVLIVMTLMAATTMAAEAENTILVTKECMDDRECKCTGEDDLMINYTVGACAKNGEDNELYYKIESCRGKTDFVVKGYKEDDCKAGIFEPPTTCQPNRYDKAECQGDTITLYAFCEEGCDSSKCKKNVTFKKGECVMWESSNYLKLTNVDCAAAEYTFEHHGTSMRCDRQEPKPFKVKKACTPVSFEQYICEADKKRAVVKYCPDSDCSDSDCRTIPIDFEEYHPDFGRVLYLESCTSTDAKLKIETYADVKQFATTCYPQGLNGAASNIAQCVEKNTSNNSDDNTTSNNSDDNTTSNSSDDNNNTNSIASAHSVGLLTLMLCLMACAY